MTERDEIETEFDDKINEEDFDGYPSTDIDVRYRIGFAMSGSFPLHITDIFFEEGGLYLLEYGSITPLLGLTTRKHRREAETMRALYKYHGIDEVILQADFVTWYNYDFVETVVIHTGGRFSRPKITFELADSSSQSYRIHDSPDPEHLKEKIEETGLQVSLRSGAGLGLSDIVR